MVGVACSAHAQNGVGEAGGDIGGLSGWLEVLYWQQSASFCVDNVFHFGDFALPDYLVKGICKAKEKHMGWKFTAMNVDKMCLDPARSIWQWVAEPRMCCKDLQTPSHLGAC